jgi:NAD(P)-dependent dehydrogenase (short-subunit alcohol dehydrogenase family)
LVNNAGIYLDDGLSVEDGWDIENVRKQFEVNALGPLKIVRAILPNLGANSKIVMISSLMGSIEDNTSGSRYGYRMSKAALNMASMSLHRDLTSRQIHVVVINPGMVATDMNSKWGIVGGKNGAITTQTSVAGMIPIIEKLDEKTSGKFFHYDGKSLPW